MVRGASSTTSASGTSHRKDREGLSTISKLSSHSLFSGSHIHMLHGQCRTEARLTCRTICRDYCNNTAVHGFRYFFEKNRSVQERTFWVLGVFFCFATAFYLISKIWMKWETSPVIVTFADHPTPVWEIPFPAVTICPATKIKRDKFNFTYAHHQILENTTSEDLRWRYRALSLVCMTEIADDTNHFSEHEYNYLREVAPTLDDVIYECWWQFKKFNCSEYFRESMTEEGLCYSFNSLGDQELYRETKENTKNQSRFRSSGWSIDSGYINDDPSGVFYPRRSLFFGPAGGLRVTLRSNDEDMDYICRGCEQGFRVLLHSPAVPAWSGHQTALSLNTSMLLQASPLLMQTSPGLRHYTPQRRSCFFPEERALRLFKHYTQENCLWDCFSNITIAKCGCTLLGVSQVEDVHVCRYSSRCVESNFDNLMNENRAKIPFEGCIPDECNCLPTCNSLRYGAQGSVFDFPWLQEKQAKRELPPKGVSFSQLNVYFDSLQYITRRRSELYGRTDFLANFGGLLGLFTGFSVISLVEVVYYVSLRLWCDVRRRREERRRRQ